MGCWPHDYKRVAACWQRCTKCGFGCGPPGGARHKFKRDIHLGTETCSVCGMEFDIPGYDDGP